MEMVNECNNANCKSNSDELVIAKEAAILYYRFDMSHKKVHKICKTCDEDAETFMQVCTIRRTNYLVIMSSIFSYF